MSTYLKDSELYAHRTWIGYLQPVGLVVSPPALLAAQAVPDRNILEQQQALLALVDGAGAVTEADAAAGAMTGTAAGDQPDPRGRAAGTPAHGRGQGRGQGGRKRRARRARPGLAIADFPAFTREVLGWKADKLAGGPAGPALPDALSVPLAEFGEVLRPTYAVPAPKNDPEPWLMLIQEVPAGADLDRAPNGNDEDGGGSGTDSSHRRWHASPHARLERLLRANGVPIGLLTNGTELRLVYAPRGETSGYITWPVYAMCQVAGRDLLSALCMLLGRARLFALPREQRLPHILRESRTYQNLVSEKLAGQVLEALNELLRGFQAADEASRGQLLGHVAREYPEHVYGGLLAVILRLVFVLYAEEGNMLSGSELYVRNYALTGLFERLRAANGRYPDTMDQRFGAWSQILVLFRMIHDGAARGDFRLPARHGHLFDPDGWGFLEGRGYREPRVLGARVDVPRVSDGVIFRVLDKLLMLDGERLSYRTLDVEQIGSVYENMMGFRLERAAEISIGVGAQHVVVGLETLLAKKGKDRNTYLKSTADIALSGKALAALGAAATVDEVMAALGRRVSPLTPRPVPAGGLYLQPTDERRRSGSHYTPRELTAPIVATTLRPLLAELGPSPRPEAILELKICDPAMGSGAFLVETCRQLGAELARAYAVHGMPADLPPDEDIERYAQRLVAQRCLYGVDKNPYAVDLGKLSLWLTTLAKDHPFTFVDHSLRRGDSLVGLTREQIACFDWDIENQVPTIRAIVEKAVGEALRLRREIQALAGSDDVRRKQELLDDANAAIARVRLIGDCVVACFFSESKARARGEARQRWADKVQEWIAGRVTELEIRGFVDEVCGGEPPVPCFHWEIEFPEVFGREVRGFDGFVGNPPFAGKNTMAAGNQDAYPDWLKVLHEDAHGNSDLVAHFYRRAFNLVRKDGCFGLIATNTIGQGDTRSTGLRWIRTHGGTIYSAQRRLKWPGQAAVIVSVVHVRKGQHVAAPVLDGQEVEIITAFLFHRGGDDDPVALGSNAGKSFQGSIILGMGFTFDDTDKKSVASPIAEMHRLIAKDPRNAERIFPYIGGEEINSSPSHSHHRHVINFGEMSEQEARQWPDLMAIVEDKVKPERERNNRDTYKNYWWQHGEKRPALYRAIRGMDRVLVTSRHQPHWCLTFSNTGTVFSEALIVFAQDTDATFATLQSRPHEVWTRFFGSTLEDRLRYTPSDCFETFPFPDSWQSSPTLESAGKTYYDFRAALMVRNNEGMTATYNRFHDPDEIDPDILTMRTLHDAMDRAVLDAYGWTDITPTCEFLLDYEDADAADDDTDAKPGARRRMKPWRYRWPDDVRDEILARLLDLNARRAAAEAAAAGPKGGGRKKSPARSKPTPEPPDKPPTQGQLF